MRSPRRKTSWVLGPGEDDLGTSVNLSADGTTIFGSGISPTIDELTLVRLHGEMRLTMTSVAAAADGFGYAIGVGICTADAFAIGVTAVPNPFDDIDWPGWLFHDIGFLYSTAASVGHGLDCSRAVPIESKAMRKLRTNEVMFLAIQVDEIGTATLNVNAATRALFKLP